MSVNFKSGACFHSWRKKFLTCSQIGINMRYFISKLLQLALIAMGIMLLLFLLIMPCKEGRAAQLTILEVYSDPLILFIYGASIPFFIALIQSVGVLNFVRRNSFVSQDCLSKLRVIRKCLILLAILLAIAAAWIQLFHDKSDDPAGFLAVSFLLIFMVLSSIFLVRFLEKKLKRKLGI